MGSAASVPPAPVDEFADPSAPPVLRCHLKQLPDLIEEVVFVRDKWPLILVS